MAAHATVFAGSIRRRSPCCCSFNGARTGRGWGDYVVATPLSVSSSSSALQRGASRSFNTVTNLPNVTTLTNTRTNIEEVAKWGGGATSSERRGIPQKTRFEMKKITILHESPSIILAGRHRANNFGSNQYLIASKKTSEAVLIDMCDDWPDDWVAFLNTSKLSLKCIFFTHLHLDNVLGVVPFFSMMPSATVAFHGAEDCWVARHADSCQRYKRMDAARLPMPFHDWTSPQRMALTGTSNRLSTFIELGDVLLFYMHTPGHSPGHMMLSVPREKLLFTGDTLFYDQVGRIDVPWGAGEMLAQSLRMLEDMPDNTVLLPGHGRITTLGRERRSNRGLQRVYEWIRCGRTNPCVGVNEGGWF